MTASKPKDIKRKSYKLMEPEEISMKEKMFDYLLVQVAKVSCPPGKDNIWCDKTASVKVCKDCWMEDVKKHAEKTYDSILLLSALFIFAIILCFTLYQIYKEESVPVVNGIKSVKGENVCIDGYMHTKVNGFTYIQQLINGPNGLMAKPCEEPGNADSK